MAANTTRKPQTRKKTSSENTSAKRKPVARKSSKAVAERNERNDTILREAILLIVIAFSIERMSIELTALTVLLVLFRQRVN